MTTDLLAQHPELMLPPTAPLRDAIASLTKAQMSIVLVAGPDRVLLGVITDIDIRKSLLKGADLGVSLDKVMNAEPVTILDTVSPEEAAEVFRRTQRAYIPVVDAKKRVKSLAALSDYSTIPKRYPNWMVIMAGGVGKRLLPLTENTPKPMLKLGNKPILELLLEQCAASGFTHFIFTVNYLGEQIEKHFGDGSRWGVQIEYVREDRPLGTVGALSLIDRKFSAPILVANGDILTKVNFGALLDFHKAEGGAATLCVKHHEIQVPYGVVELAEHRLDSFVEKPVHRFLVNAGIYVLEPEALTWLAKDKPCDMPDFLKEIRRRKPQGVACFPIQEYWLDIGGHQEFNRAAGEYEEHFEDK